MKNQTRRDKKLPLRKEIVRTLDKLELGDVAGGVVKTFFTLQRSCVDC